MQNLFNRCACIGTGVRLLRRAPLSALICSTLIFTAISPGYAADAPSFGALLQRAQVNAPQLLEQAANVRAASAEARQAGAWLNPTLNAVSENIGVSQAGVGQREDTYSVTQAFEISGKRAARIEAGQSRTVAASALERQTRVAFASDLAIAYATAEAMQQRQQVALAELTRARDDLRAADVLVKAGREANLRLAQARAGAAAAEAAVESASAELTGAVERLGALAGALEPYSRIVHSLLGTAAPTLPTALWNPDDNPALATATAERDALTAQIRIEQKRLLPDIGVTLGMRRFGYTEQKAATIGVSLSIPLFDRNKDGIDAARRSAPPNADCRRPTRARPPRSMPIDWAVSATRPARPACSNCWPSVVSCRRRRNARSPRASSAYAPSLPFHWPKAVSHLEKHHDGTTEPAAGPIHQLANDCNCRCRGGGPGFWRCADDGPQGDCTRPPRHRASDLFGRRPRQGC
jgi:cobalt-zinc-cadmium efflux system outer membrane protein